MGPINRDGAVRRFEVHNGVVGVGGAEVDGGVDRLEVECNGRGVRIQLVLLRTAAVCDWAEGF